MDIANPELERYATEHTSPEGDLLAELALATSESLDAPGMMVGPLEGTLLAMLVAATGTTRVLEIGTFSGYSALSMAQALPEGGRIITLEISERHASFAQAYIDKSPHAGKIEIRLGPASESLSELEGPFGFVFIDADKGGYRDYYEHALRLLGEGGIICVDNTLWSGRVLGESPLDADSEAMMEFNDFVVRDERVVCVQLTVRDGVTLIRKKQ